MSSYGLWLSTAGMRVNEHRQALLANNLANVQTKGFKQDTAVVRERAVESHGSPDAYRFAHPVLDGITGGVDVRPTHHDFLHGPIEQTGRPLDLAIESDGFFSVSDGNVTRYTRNGEFTMNSTGELVLSAGQGRWRVLDHGGRAIRVDPAAGSVSVSQDGTIRQGSDEIGVLRIVDTDDKASLRKVGENLFELDGGDQNMTRIDGRVRSGALEGSNADVMRGLAAMIEASRAYELNAKMIRLQDEATGRAVGLVGRLA